MSTKNSNFNAVLFVQLCGGEPALYDPTCQGNIEAASKRISRTLVQRGADRLNPESVKPLFDHSRAIYEKEVENRAQGGYSELKWFHPMDVYMRPFINWAPGWRCSGPRTSGNVSDPAATNNKNNVNEPEMVGEVSHSVPRSSLEKTVKENRNEKQALGKETKVTNEISNKIDTGMTSIANSKDTARKSFNTPTKNSPKILTIVGKKKEIFTSPEMNASSSTLCSNTNLEAAKSGGVQNEPEDDPCDVCRSVLPEEGNEMPYCDSCDVCVHQACYGVAKLPDGQWFCSPCSVNIKPLCALCPKPGGAMKRTSDERQWAHVSCAWWIKEVKFDIPDKMEAINISNIAEDRWKLVCSLCQMKHGVCMQCMVPRCTVAYHVTCALDKGLTMEICDAQENEDGVKWVSYCKRHSRIKTPNSQKKRNQKRKSRRSSVDVKKSFARKRSASSHGDYYNDAITSPNVVNILSETESTSDSSSLGSGTDLSTTQSSEASEGSPAKRVKRSGCKQSPAPTTPRKNQSNAEREPGVTPQGKPISFDKGLYSFNPSTNCDATQKTNFQGQHCEVQNKSFESTNKRHDKIQSSSNTSSPQGKQQALLDLPGSVLTKNETTTPLKRVSFSSATPSTAQTDNTTKSSTAMKKPPSAHFQSCQPPIDKSNSPVENHSSSTSVDCHTLGKRRLFLFKNQSENRPFAEEPLSVPQEHPPNPQNHSLPSTSIATHFPTEEPSSCSLDHEQSNEAQSTTTTTRSKTASIKQLTKFVAVYMQKLSQREAMKLERRIVCLCLKSYRKSENHKK